jgi:uncharacterized protein
MVDPSNQEFFDENYVTQNLTSSLSHSSSLDLTLSLRLVACIELPKKKEKPILMHCPKCKTEALAGVIVEGVTVDRCSACAGVWFDAEELSESLSGEAQHVARLLKSSVSERADGKKGRCPRDDSELMRVYSSIDRSVVLDACGECRGVWLDGGEFEKLFAALRH